MDVAFGNASELPDAQRGWLVGSFIASPGNLHHSPEVAVKWMKHDPGAARTEWAQNDATSLTLLIHGRFRMIFQDGEFLLSREGDYVMWAPGVLHKWVADEPSLMLTIRWLS